MWPRVLRCSCGLLRRARCLIGLFRHRIGALGLIIDGFARDLRDRLIRSRDWLVWEEMGCRDVFSRRWRKF